MIRSFKLLNPTIIIIGIVCIAFLVVFCVFLYKLDGDTKRFKLINFVFDQLGLEKLNCEVIETNDSVVKLHKKFGFQEEGFRRENIVKNEQRIGVYFLGLTKSDWVVIKDTVLSQYGKVIDKFDIKIEYEAQ